MTIKLYYEDSETAEAEVGITSSSKDQKGFYAILDQTCFYPEGGGQPSDRGSIGSADVLDVQVIDGEIRHYTNIPLDKGRYSAMLDWNRRWDHMQQHAGQHVLSAVLDDVFGLKTNSFHLGEERVSIDLEAENITAEILREAEKAANEVIRRHLPISVEWVSETQAKKMPLRKAPAVTGEIRLVKIQGIDLNACGGTHPKNTADIGQIRIISTEKAKGGTRVYFLCGNRASDYFRKLIGISDELVRQMNAPVRNLPEAAAALLGEKASMEKELKEMQAKMLGMEAQIYQPDEGQFVEKVFTDRSIKEIQQLARLTAANYPEAYLLFISLEKTAIRFVCAKGENARGDMGKILKQLLALTDGKGGGNADFAQGGGGIGYSTEDLINVFRDNVKNIQGTL